MTTDAHRQGYVAGSVLAELISRMLAQVRVWIAATWVGRVGATAGNALGTAVDTSAAAVAYQRFIHFIRHSFCYRWLTAEPDPDVIVIDLRETYTVGPVITLFDRLTPFVERTWDGSFASRVTERLRTSSKREWFEKSKAVQLLKAALEPPELPDEKQE